MKKIGERPSSRRTVALALSRRGFWQLLLLVGGGLLLYFALTQPRQVGKLLGGFVSLFSPFLLGGAIAFLLNVLVRQLERLWNRIFRRSNRRIVVRMKRPVCMVLSLLILAGIVALLLFMLLPELYAAIRDFVNNIGRYSTQLMNWWDGIRGFADGFGLTLPTLELHPEAIRKTLTEWLEPYQDGVLNTAIDLTSSLVSGVVNTVIALAFSLYLLAQKERVGRALRRLLDAFLPESFVQKTVEVVTLTNRIFTSFVTGQLTEATILGFLCFLGMLIFRMPHAGLVSVLIGVTALVPVFGAIVGAVIGAFLILLVEPMKALWFLVFLIVLQQLEENLIYPKVVGKSVGLPGLLVLMAITVGGSVGGVLGMLLSVPTTAVAFALIYRAVESRTAKKAAAAAAQEAAEEAVVEVAPAPAEPVPGKGAD